MGKNGLKMYGKKWLGNVWEKMAGKCMGKILLKMAGENWLGPGARPTLKSESDKPSKVTCMTGDDRYRKQSKSIHFDIAVHCGLLRVMSNDNGVNR